MGISEKFIMISNKKNEVYRWIFNNDESIKNSYTIPLQEREKGVFTKFFCEPNGNHTIIKHNKYMFYFNFESQKIKELYRLRDINIESIAWEDKSTINSTNVFFYVILANFNWN